MAFKVRSVLLSPTHPARPAHPPLADRPQPIRPNSHRNTKANRCKHRLALPCLPLSQSSIREQLQQSFLQVRQVGMNRRYLNLYASLLLLFAIIDIINQRYSCCLLPTAWFLLLQTHRLERHIIVQSSVTSLPAITEYMTHSLNIPIRPNNE